jgi:type II secretory ATPase GspE/PulE/Tfp pilus assembly ATPase PilB-like protein
MGPCQFRRPIGCEQCAGTGYSGRTCIYEIARITDELRQLTVNRAPEAEIEACARDQGMRSLLECGIGKAAAGETSLDEVMRAALVVS